MSNFVDSKKMILDFIKSDCTSVMTLVGPWGIGKTYLWKEVLLENKSTELFGNSVYASLFGISSMDELKSKLVGQLWSGFTGRAPKLKQALNSKILSVPAALSEVAVNTGSGWLKKITGSSLSGSIVTLLPKLMSGRLIILDDLERKRSSLDISEVAGFINEYAEMYGVKFLIILNEDELEDIDSWQKCFEKVVDRRVFLNPTVQELVEIPSKPYSGEYIAEAKKAMISLDIRSVRAIGKIFLLLDDLLKNEILPSDDFLPDIIPGAVLIGAIHYNGLESDLTVDCVLKSGCKVSFENQNKAYDLIVSKIRASGGMRFCSFVSNYLKFGNCDVNNVSDILLEYRKEQGAREHQKNLDKFFTMSRFGRKTTQEDLLEFAKRLELTPLNTNALVMSSVVNEIESQVGSASSLEILADWCSFYENNFNAADRSGQLGFFSEYEIHPGILFIMKRAEKSDREASSILDLTLKMNLSNGYSKKDAEDLEAAKWQEYLNEIHAADLEDLRDLIISNFEHCKYSDDPLRKSLFNKFSSACGAIILHGEDERLKDILIREFLDRGFEIPKAR